MKQFIFLGDSITDCDHIYDTDNLGYGYVRVLSEKLSTNNYQFINLGYDGFTISALKRLWERICSPLNPACITILIGINDIGVIKNTGVSPDFALNEFQMNYELLIENIRKHYDCPIILMEPFIFSRPAEYLTWELEVHKMGKCIEAIAVKHQLCYLPIWHSLKDNSLTTDGIHLTTEGHAILADMWFDFTKNLEII